jgi:IclR family pca regulon transcriptional regulator
MRTPKYDARPASVEEMRMPKPPERRDFVQSLERGLAVILAFSDHHPQLTLSEIAALTSLSKPTVRRVLLTLQELGYVRSEGRFFALTPNILALGYAYLSSLNLTEIAQPHMEAVVEKTGLGCSLATLAGTDVVYVTRVPTYRLAGITLTTGTRLPAYATSMGHVLLAHLSPADLDRYLDRVEMRPLTPRTLVTPAELLTRLAAVKAQGWAMVDQELEDGLRSLSAPVREASGNVIAALGMTGTTATVDTAKMLGEFAPVLIDAAHSISEQLGAAFSRQDRRSLR